MKKIDDVCDLIKKSVFVGSTDEVLVNANKCSVRIISVGTIDEEGLRKYLFDKLDEIFVVFEADTDDESIIEWKEVNGIEEDVNYYDILPWVDDDVINDILQEEYDVKIFDDTWDYIAILEGEISKDEILGVLKEYGISGDRVNVYVNSLRFFKGTEVQIEVYS